MTFCILSSELHVFEFKLDCQTQYIHSHGTSVKCSYQTEANSLSLAH
jgi:hypothetical protein